MTAAPAGNIISLRPGAEASPERKTTTQMANQQPCRSVPDSRLSRRRKLLFTGALVAAVLVVGELLARALGPDSGVAHSFIMRQGLEVDQERDVIRDPYPGVPYLLRPQARLGQHWPSNPRGRFDEPGHRLTYRVNRAGFRGEDFSKDKTGAVRVVFLGDSFCWGLGVRDDDHFIHRLGGKLRSSGLFEGRFELLNFGQGGYNTAMEVALFEHLVLEYAPEVAVIWFFLNDWEYGGQVAATSRYLGGNRLLRTPRRYCRLLDMVVTPIDTRWGRNRLIETFRAGYEENSPGWQATCSALERFAVLCRDNEVVPVLAIHPVLINLNEDYPFTAVHQKVARQAGSAGIYTVDLFSAFRGRSAPQLWVHPLDQHPNEEGHRLAADYFFEGLGPVLQENERTIRRHLSSTLQ